MERREKKAVIEWYTVIFVRGACTQGGASVNVSLCERRENIERARSLAQQVFSLFKSKASICFALHR